MAQIHRKSPVIKKRESTWHPKHPKKETITSKIRKQVTPERIAKVGSAASSLAKGFHKFMDWGASRAGVAEMRGVDMNNPMGTQKRRTTKRKTKKNR